MKAATAAAALLVLAALAAGCGSSSKSSSSSGSSSSGSSSSSSSSSGGSAASLANVVTSGGKKGGIYRVGWEQSFGFTDNFDPTGEYLGDAFGIMDNLLVRTLVGYKHVVGPDGNTLVPDLATSVPKPTNGGKTYTFHLKSGIKFGPPVNREITSKDIAYALERIADTKDGAQYAFYYTVIKGWPANATSIKPISGIQTPNDKTIIFNLTKPTGDFLYRLSMPATGPIPPEIGKCFEGKAGNYGRDVISSGPYMIQGSDKVSASCPMKPMSGYNPLRSLTLVRNPSYNQSTDPYRQNLPDEFQWTIDANADDIYNRTQNGQLDDNVATETPKVLAQYTSNPNLKKSLHQFSGDRTWYLTMNLTQPPFDDIHIRKAMNLIMDKQGLRRGWGGPTAGAIATHIVPDAMFNDQIKGYDPYATPNESGDLAKAKAEVKLSKYDSNKDGICDASACKNILLLSDTRSVDTRMVPVIESSAKKIGITFTVRSVNGAYPVLQTPSKNIPIGERPGWGKDYADALTFFQALFTSGAIIPQGNTNYSLVGITPAIAKKVGVKGDLKNIPSIDSKFNACTPKTGQARLACWENLDKYLMTNVVPWVPYLYSYATDITGPKVTQWQGDQFSGTPAYSRVAVR
jgi:peptide/nickel transport system substrate-binding protein